MSTIREIVMPPGTTPGSGLIDAPNWGNRGRKADAADLFFQLQPYKGGWLVVDHGVSCGFVKKLKAGWKKDGYSYPEALERAVRLLGGGS